MSDYEVQYTVTLHCTTDNAGTGHPSDETVADAVRGMASQLVGPNVQDVSAVLEFDGEDA